MEYLGLLSILAVTLALFKHLNEKRENKKKELLIINEHKKANRYRYSDFMRTLYLRSVDPDSIDADSFLISKKEWIPEELVDLSYLKLDIMDDGYPDVFKVKARDIEPYKIRSIFMLPDWNKTYSSNLCRHLSSKMFPADVYRLVDTRTGTDSLTALMARSNYFSFIDTCEYMAYSATKTINELPRNLNDAAKCSRVTHLKDVLDLNNRCVATGICTLTVIKNVKNSEGQTGDYFLLHRRSDNVDEAPNVVSLVPAGSFQPLKNVDNPNDILIVNILKEFDEEIKGMSEYEYAETYSLSNDIEGMEFYFLGMGLDPLSTKLEIIACMMIPCEKLGLQGLRSDCSLSEIEASIKGSYEGRIELHPFNQESLTRQMRSIKAMPVYREAMRIALERFF